MKFEQSLGSNPTTKELVEELQKFALAANEIADYSLQAAIDLLQGEDWEKVGKKLELKMKELFD